MAKREAKWGELTVSMQEAGMWCAEETYFRICDFVRQLVKKGKTADGYYVWVSKDWDNYDIKLRRSKRCGENYYCLPLLHAFLVSMEAEYYHQVVENIDWVVETTLDEMEITAGSEMDDEGRCFLRVFGQSVADRCGTLFFRLDMLDGKMSPQNELALTSCMLPEKVDVVGRVPDEILILQGIEPSKRRRGRWSIECDCEHCG